MMIHPSCQLKMLKERAKRFKIEVHAHLFQKILKLFQILSAQSAVESCTELQNCCALLPPPGAGGSAAAAERGEEPPQRGVRLHLRGHVRREHHPPIPSLRRPAISPQSLNNFSYGVQKRES